MDCGRSCLVLLAAAASAAPPEPTKILVNGVELHYISAGTGEPVILLHGGQGDYRSWEPQMAALSRYYHVISYSRRYNFPNQNPQTATNHSALVEAADLAALIKALRLKRANLVGTSMGAATALTLAIEHPNMVRSLVLAEPPILAWAKHFPDGGKLYKDFMRRIQNPARDAFAAGNDEAAMRFFVDGFATAGTVRQAVARSAARRHAERGLLQDDDAQRESISGHSARTFVDCEFRCS